MSEDYYEDGDDDGTEADYADLGVGVCLAKCEWCGERCDECCCD